MRQLLEIGAYVPLVQERLVQAQYWHDPETSKYIQGNIFLAAMNNDAPTKNVTFAKRLAARELPSCRLYCFLSLPPVLLFLFWPWFCFCWTDSARIFAFTIMSQSNLSSWSNS